MIGNKLFFSTSPTDISCVYWSCDKYDAELGFRISNTSIILHSQTPKTVSSLRRFINKLSLLNEEIDFFIHQSLNSTQDKKRSIRKWLNPTNGNDSEYSGSVCHFYSKMESYLEISSCDRSHRFYVTPNKDNSLCNKKTLPQLTLIKTMIGECVTAVKNELKNTSNKPTTI